MSEHVASIHWTRGDAEFTYETYSRAHTVRFANGIELAASAAPAFLGDADRVDPEASFVAALSSCHMLTFLAIAARKRLVVEGYEDAAIGYLEKNAEGRLAMTRVVLRPKVVFGGAPPEPEQLKRMHATSHRNCFIANSVTTSVTVEPARVEPE
ncbi:MAG: OsmC family protein [Sandaracinaceae bacterium]